MLVYPYERYLRWALAQGWSDNQIRTQTQQYDLYASHDFAQELDALRQEVEQGGGKALARRQEEGRGLTPRLLEKVVGAPDDLADGRLLGRLETILHVKPARHAVQLLSCAGLAPERVSDEVHTRYGMRLPPDLLANYYAYFWGVGKADYAELYQYLECWPPGEDKELYTICLGKDLRFLFWRLNLEPLASASEGEALKQFIHGAQQMILNAVDPDLNPRGIAPTQWMNNYAAAREMLYEWEDRNRVQSIDAFAEEIKKRILLKRSDGEDHTLPELGLGKFQHVE